MEEGLVVIGLRLIYLWSITETNCTIMMVENRKEEGWERESWTGQIAPAVEIHHRHVLHHVGNGLCSPLGRGADLRT
jgi:hypothetical protein